MVNMVNFTSNNIFFSNFLAALYTCANFRNLSRSLRDSGVLLEYECTPRCYRHGTYLWSALQPTGMQIKVASPTDRTASFCRELFPNPDLAGASLWETFNIDCDG